MESTQIIKNKKDIISPEKKSDIPFSSVKFSKTWTFWESYISKDIKLSYNEANKQIFKNMDILGKLYK